MKYFLQFLKKESTDFRTPLIAAIVGAGIINGVGMTVAVKAIESVKGGETNLRAFLLFAACIAGYWLSKEMVLNRTTVILEQIVERLRLRILSKIAATDLLRFEAMDKGRIYATLSTDAVNISTSAEQVINASSSLVMLLFTLVLIATMSFNALIVTVGVIGIVVIYYFWHSRRVSEHLARATKKENEFFENLNGLLNGFKELKLNRDKRGDYFHEEIEGVVHSTRAHREDAGKAMNHSVLIAHTYLFFTLAGLIFVLPLIAPAEAFTIPMVVPVVLFAAGPLADCVGALPALARAEASIINIHQLEEGIDQRVEAAAPVAAADVEVSAPATFESLKCEALTFQYPVNGRHPFTIQPTNFELKAGQVVFIVGGNGSGKSTFLKLLTGLYRPGAGRLWLNGAEIHDGNVVQLREMFSPIFTDFHLFKRVLGAQAVDEHRVAELLEQMELADKTAIIDRRVTNMDLSTGQRKRLALVLSTLDNRPVHVFDEWAADQDPVFRRFFYEVLLRRMVSEGKTILAVTHDDHYFHVADQVYLMEYGAMKPYVPAIRKREAHPRSQS